MTMVRPEPENSIWVCRPLNIVMILLLCGCAFTNTVTGPGGPPVPVGATSSIQNGLSLAVWLEDLCEGQETDARSLTMLEALHDGLVVPTEALFAISVVTVVSIFWSLYDRITLPAGELLPNRPEMVMAYVKPHRAGPRIDTRAQTSNVPIAWHGCLSGYGESEISRR